MNVSLQNLRASDNETVSDEILDSDDDCGDWEDRSKVNYVKR